MSIDYDSLRQEGSDAHVVKPLSISIDQFVPDILDGGVPVFDTILSIEVNDDDLGKYDYEIIYVEIQ